MPLNYIIFENRKIVVVDGQPYYQSSGENSHVKGRWLPFIMIRGTDQDGVLNYAALEELGEEYNTNKLKKVLSEKEFVPNYFIKYSASILNIKDLNQLNRLHNTYEVYVDSVGASTIFDYARLPTKITCIVSSRLSGGKEYNDALLEKFGLTPDEIKQAKTPIFLATEPSEVIVSDDKVNKWLVVQRAVIKCLNKSLFKYASLWQAQKKLVEKEIKAKFTKESLQDEKCIENINREIFLQQSKKILLDYTKGSRWNRFWAGTWRNHIDIVNEVLENKHTNAAILLESLRDKIRKKRKQGIEVNMDGDLINRIIFLERQLEKEHKSFAF